MSAYAGAAALATGIIDMGTTIEERFPFGSTAFAAIALTLVVAVPMTVAARQAATGGPHATTAALIAGTSLIGWIVVEIAFIRTFSWLQPTFAAAGTIVLLAGIWSRFRQPAP